MQLVLSFTSFSPSISYMSISTHIMLNCSSTAQICFGRLRFDV